MTRQARALRAPPAREYDDARELSSSSRRSRARSREQLAPVRAELARLQEEALFNGEYDGGDAVVTINAGTGGTDAQDWAEMLLRMYLRWTADRGFQTELVEASPGEEAGLKSATLTVQGENAYGLFKAERGVHRLVRLSPFDSAHRRHTAFAQVVVAPLLPGRRRRRDRRGRPADRHVPRERRRRPARQQDRLRRADHAPPDRDRRPVPERALADVEQADRDADPPLAARRARRGGAGGRAREGAGRRAGRRRLRKPDPLLRAAPVPAGQGPPDRLRGRERAGRARRRRSTASSRRTCSREPPAKAA